MPRRERRTAAGLSTTFLGLETSRRDTRRTSKATSCCRFPWVPVRDEATSCASRARRRRAPTLTFLCVLFVFREGRRVYGSPRRCIDHVEKPPRRRCCQLCEVFAEITPWKRFVFFLCVNSSHEKLRLTPFFFLFFLFFLGGSGERLFSPSFSPPSLSLGRPTETAGRIFDRVS